MHAHWHRINFKQAPWQVVWFDGRWFNPSNCPSSSPFVGMNCLCVCSVSNPGWIGGSSWFSEWSYESPIAVCINLAVQAVFSSSDNSNPCNNHRDYQWLQKHSGPSSKYEFQVRLMYAQKHLIPGLGIGSFCFGRSPMGFLIRAFTWVTTVGCKSRWFIISCVVSHFCTHTGRLGSTVRKNTNTLRPDLCLQVPQWLFGRLLWLLASHARTWTWAIRGI